MNEPTHAEPRVSVVIPLYEAAATITAALDSVAAQTLPAHEVLIVDDGSRDDGAAVAEAHPLRPRVLRQANAGPAAARNRGVEAAEGELIAFLDADDLWKPEKLARQVEVFRQRPELGLVFHDTEYFSERDGERQVWNLVPRPQKTSLWAFLLANQVPMPTAVIPRRVWVELGGFDEHPELIGVEDYVFWLELVARYPVHYLPACLSLVRSQEVSLMGREWAENVTRGTHAVARVLSRQPQLSWQEFHLPPRLFLHWHLTRQLLRSFLHARPAEGVTWRGRLRVLRFLLRDARRLMPHWERQA